MNRLGKYILLYPALLLGLASCSIYKYVPQGSYLLDKVEVSSSDKKIDALSYRDLAYQTPNSKWFGLFRIPLRIYSLSGTAKPDSKINRMLRDIGEEPVLYDALLSEASSLDMKHALMNKGYLNAEVRNSYESGKKPKATVRYDITPGKRFVVDTVMLTVQDSAVSRILADASERSLLVKGMNLDADILDDERTRIVDLVRKFGYYRFNKDYISYVADTAKGSEKVGLRMVIDAEGESPEGLPLPHTRFSIASIDYTITGGSDIKLNNKPLTFQVDSCEGFRVYHQNVNGKSILRPSVIGSHSFLREGMTYNSDSVSKTYSSLSRLGLLKYSNIKFDETPGYDDKLNANVSLVALPKHSLSFEIEGTNTAGDLGAAASMSFTDRNLFRGSEQLTLKFRGAYESISNLPGYTGDTYLEYGLEANLVFPEFLIPFMSQELQRKSQATSQFSAKINAQIRPEFQKTIFSAGWSYDWSDAWHMSHRFDVIDLNYLVVPWISEHFRTEYLIPQAESSKSILLYNYVDLLITKIGYTFYYSNAKLGSVLPFQYSLRAAFETSGNVLNLLSEPLDFEQNDEGQYMFMGIAYAQYAKHDFSFTANWPMDKINNLVFHLEWGVAVPYGNSTSLPFEKRYFSGGANSVRGWAVRELGPGTFQGGDKTIDYIRQSGDIKFGASLEYRSKLFWKVNAAAFVDAGNIWTIRDYPEQPGGLFKLDTFFEQIALSYGLGLRFDFGFFVLRLDGGMKAYNPAGGTLYRKLPLFHPDFDRDFAFHLAVGYPF